MTKERYSLLIALFALFVLCPAKSMAQNIPPVADAGSSRYAAIDTVQLDGTGSFDPDNSGPLSCAWRQIAGPSAIIIDANTATPTICGSMQPGKRRDPTPEPGGFNQTSEIQECEFELVVSDGELTSLPDTVKVIIVPDFSSTSTHTPLIQENLPFDPNKPTVIYFDGGDCVTGKSGTSWNASAWNSRANVISFPYGYSPDSGGVPRTYYKYGDMIIVYLSSVAPDYKQPIQALGFSTGGMPAIDVGIHLNLTYADARYAVNRVTFLDVACRTESEYASLIEQFSASSVDGEQSWVDAYQTGKTPVTFLLNALNVLCPSMRHSSYSGPPIWYKNSLTNADMSQFNNGVVAGSYWSVVGPGKNLQLASIPGTMTYVFEWYGGDSSGYMDFYDESTYPGRLPEPVTLVGPDDGAVVDANGAVLSCEVSENAVVYQLLFGPDPYRVMDYYIISDTPAPPNEVITTLPYEETWWTIKARDQYGSTIYADPICINAENVTPPVQRIIENVTIGRRYSFIQDAIDEAEPHDEIVIGVATYQYLENINFKGKNLTIRSIDPNDPAIVAATVINGGDHGTVVTFSEGEEASCVLAGLTITGGNTGIYCYGASPTIANCTIAEGRAVAIELLHGSEPTITNCTIVGDVIVRPIVENLTTGEKYDYIQGAIDDAVNGDEIVLREGTYRENINFQGKNLTLRSTNPDDPATVAATVINGGDWGTVVTFSGGSSVLAGLTITGGTVGISCRDASPTIRNCTIGSNGPNAIEFWYGYEPIIIDCTILGQVMEVNDPRLVAHWKLDETEGSIAQDSAGVNDGTCHGQPLWQPVGGQIDGALAFDGTDDYVSTDFVLNPMDGAFSVFAWIKGGAPGQVVISQGGGVNWLLADPAEGKLMTELKEPGRSGSPLWSQTVITDGHWHRICLVWNGSNRMLYVDDIEEARDTQSGWEGAYGGLHIGAGTNLEAGSFFSGLIDEVRIYDRAITP